jgi:dolichol-phosphate mannosyltransferase
MEPKKQSKALELSVVVPVYNEANGIEEFHRQLKALLSDNGWSYEIIYVDDGSLDASSEIIDRLAKTDSTVHPLHLSRNFGKEISTTAGLHMSIGQASIMIDADGQHPIKLIPDFVHKWQAGTKVVVGVRTANRNEGIIKHYGSKLFYGLLKMLGVPNIIPGATDFRLIDRQVLTTFNKLTEHKRVTRALIDWLGFDREYIHFTANSREIGSASYSYKKLLHLAIDGFVSLSFTPLYLSGYLGMFITLSSFLAGLFVVIEKYFFHDPFKLGITGTALLAIFIMFLVGILLIGQGLLALYVARVYTEVQNRPLYILKDPPKSA